MKNLTDVLRALVYELFLETFYEKTIAFYFSYKSNVKIFLK